MKIFEIEYKIVKNECSEILRFYKKHGSFFYRGTKDYQSNEIFIYKIPSEYRQPKSTPNIVHYILNKIFNEIGFEVNRSNSVFVTGNENLAKNYGYPSIFIPKNGFSYLWSPIIRDLYVDYFFNPNFINDLNKISGKNNIFTLSFEKKGMVSDRENFSNIYIIENNENNATKDLINIVKDALKFEFKAHDEYIKEIIKNIKRHNNNFEKIFYDNYDIFDKILSNEGFRHTLSNSQLKKWIIKYARTYNTSDELKNILKEYFSRIYYENKGLDKAINLDNEVMFKCSGYYLLNINYKEKLLELLKEDVF